MGSYSETRNTAVDNRVAATGSALAFSSSGAGNSNALNGHIFNIGSIGDSRVSESNGSNAARVAGLRSVEINMLDGNAINRAFSFAENSLSDMLGAVITQQRDALQAQTSAADGLSAAIVAQAQQTAAATQAAQDSTASMVQYLSDNMQKIAIGAVVLLGGWYALKGAK